MSTGKTNHRWDSACFEIVKIHGRQKLNQLSGRRVKRVKGFMGVVEFSQIGKEAEIDKMPVCLITVQMQLFANNIDEIIISMVH